MKMESVYLGERKIYRTTNAKVIGIPKEVLKALGEIPEEAKIFYNFEKKCMEIFFGNVV